MNVTTCSLAGLCLITPRVLGDARGSFMETWNRRRYQDAGIGTDFVQDNLSFSRRGTLRGLHFQNPTQQGKLVSVLEGEVFDVAVDIRRSSPTFGRWHAVPLRGTSPQQLFIPPGFAHGFLVLSETALFHYKCSDYYSPGDEVTIRWDDPDIGIPWPLQDPILSTKDALASRLQDIPRERLFD